MHCRFYRDPRIHGVSGVQGASGDHLASEVNFETFQIFGHFSAGSWKLLAHCAVIQSFKHNDSKSFLTLHWHYEPSKTLL